MSKGKNNITVALESLSKTDIYSLMLFTLYKIKDIPEYSTLSELCYVLDNNSLLNFLDYYGGMTIKIPTKEEFNIVIKALILYQLVNIEKNNFDDTIKELDLKENENKVKDTYIKIINMLESQKYDFRRK